MGLQLAIGTLRSRKIRETVAPEGRILDGALNLTTREEDTGLLGKIANLFEGFKGFLIDLLPSFDLSFSGIFNWLVRATISVVNFNWQATDAQLRANIDQYNLEVARAWGGFVGTLAGTVAVGTIGAGIAITLPVIGGALLAKATWLRLLEERGPEIWDELKFALGRTFNSLLITGAINTYIYARRALKSTFPQLQGWGEDPNSRWTIAEAFEETIEDIDNETLREFTEEATEEGWESFIEGGYVIAAFWDEQMRQAEESLGPPRTGSLQFEIDDNVVQENQFTSLPENLAIANLTDQINLQRAIRNQSIGRFGGDPDLPLQVSRPYERVAKVFLLSFQDRPEGDKIEPPFLDRGKRANVHTVTLKSIKELATWSHFKRAFRPYNWGPWRVDGILTSGAVITLWVASQSVGKEVIERITEELLEEDLVKIEYCFQQHRERQPIQIRRAYPEKAILTLKRKRVDGEIRTLSGRYEQRRLEFPLWFEDRPSSLIDPVAKWPDL